MNAPLTALQVAAMDETMTATINYTAPVQHPGNDDGSEVTPAQWQDEFRTAARKMTDTAVCDHLSGPGCKALLAAYHTNDDATMALVVRNVITAALARGVDLKLYGQLSGSAVRAETAVRMALVGEEVKA